MTGDKVWINGEASLPTGVTKLTENELTVATILSESSFDYRVPVFGQGTNANLRLAYAYAAQRRLILGFGASYVYKGEYQPASITGFSEKYDPGDEVSVNAGLDYTSFSKTDRFSFDLTVTNYLPDKPERDNQKKIPEDRRDGSSFWSALSLGRKARSSVDPDSVPGTT